MIYKKIGFKLLLLLSTVSFGQSIIVNSNANSESNLSAENLVKEVLLTGGECSEITWTKLKENPSSTHRTNRSWGYFEKGNTDFPFEKGIILTSGKAVDAQGPNNAPGKGSGDTNWTGDPDISNYLGDDTFNATVFEFDFKPLSSKIEFNYIFASEEYEGYECDFNDGFAFIISGPGIIPDAGSSGKNIALVDRGSYGIVPVTIDNVNGVSTCRGDSSEFYEQNPSGGQVIQYNGRTVVFKAQSDVESGEMYHIKLVVADAVDESYDSAVFLEAGSFDLGNTIVDGGGLDLGNEASFCEGVDIDLTASTEMTNPVFEWYKDDVLIPGETGDVLENITEAGLYAVKIIAEECEAYIETDITINDALVFNDAELISCDNFGLEEAEAQISTVSTVEFSYYLSLSEAEQEVNPITNLNDFATTNPTTVIYVKAEDPSSTCEDIIELTLTKKEVTVQNNVLLELCDDNTDGKMSFDLSLAEVSTDQGATFKYYLTQNDANNQANEITSPYTNTSNNQVIYVGVTTAGTACYAVGSIVLKVNEAPVLNTAQLEDCANIDGEGTYDLISANISANVYNYTYHTTQADAEGDLNAIATPEVYLSETATIWVKAVNPTTNCTAITTIELLAKSVLILQTDALVTCEIEQDKAVFDLTSANLSANPYVYTYHLTEIEAEDNLNPIATPEAYLSETATIWVKALDTTTGCASIITIDLTVNLLPNLSNDELVQCETTVGAITSIFDLTSANISTETHNYTYHISQADAEGNLNPIATPENYSSSTATIWVNAKDINTNCQEITKIDLVVNDLPVLTNATLDQCELGNGAADFNLTSANISAETYNYTYHTTQGDAEDGLNPIATPENYNSATATIWVNAKDVNTNCAEITTIELIVIAMPVLNTAELEQCETTVGATTSIFDLTSANISANVYNYTYHATQADAEGNLNPIANPESYSSQTATIWVNAKDTVTNCESITSIELVVNELPLLTAGELVSCEIESGAGLAIFDLSTAGVSTNTYNYTYHITQQDAENNANPIVEVTNYTSATKIIWARATDLNTDCPSVISIELIVSELPVLMSAKLVECESEDAKAYFDLTTANIGLDIYTYTYYANEQDADQDLNQIENPTVYYTAATNVWARALNVNTACHAIISIELEVNPMPVLTAVDFENCEIIAGNTTNVFDLTSANISANTYDYTYHTSEQDAENKANLIETPSAYSTSTTTIWVRAEDILTDCLAITTINITVNSLPVVEDAMLEYCDINNSGVSIFNLSDADTLVTSEDNVTVSYYLNQEDAEAQNNSLTSPYTALNALQTVAVKVENTQTQCVSYTSLVLKTNQNDAVSLELIECDDDLNDDAFTFDLSQMDSQFSVGFPGSTVQYYLNEQDAIAETNPLNTNYTNISNPQTIYTRVSGTIACRVGTLELKVLDSPILNLEDEVFVCMDKDGDLTNNPVGLTLDAGDGYTTYLWSTGETTQTIDLTTEGTYSIEVTNDNGCSDSHTFTVKKSSEPVISNVISTETQIIVTASGDGEYEYSIDGQYWQVYNVFTNLNPGVYTVYVRDVNGCGQITSQRSIFGIPNVFTPNGDGYNDYWRVLYMDDIKGAVITLYDRYGKKLLVSDLSELNWDGRYQGKPVPSDNYWYIVQFENGTKSNGSLSVIRTK